MAFHPRFRENGKSYLKHQVFEEGKIATVLVEKRADADLKKDSGRPSRRLLKIVSVTQDHSGGCIQFGPDGYLYLGMGDTGPQQDPQGHGQDTRLLLGKMLRIDVDHTEEERAYAIPADNPFRGQTEMRDRRFGLYGFREPWRFSFDSLTGDLWVGDVGQDRVEEVTIVRRGENHGWNVYEGFEPFSNSFARKRPRIFRRFLPIDENTEIRSPAVMSIAATKLVLLWRVYLRRLYIETHLGFDSTRPATDDGSANRHIAAGHRLLWDG